jgi:DNA invertase Pin-like site-specific DNA recombinase
MSVAVYLRVSTLDQEKGIASQEKAIADYLAGHSITDVVWYRDRMSGKNLQRPEFDRMSKAIFNGTHKTVIVWKLDRLSRSLRDGINVLCDYLAKDVRVIAVSQQLDFSGSVGQMIASVLFAVAQMERENLRENTKRGLAAAKSKGVRLGQPIKIDANAVAELRNRGLGYTAIARQLGCTAQGARDSFKRSMATVG